MTNTPYTAFKKLALDLLWNTEAKVLLNQGLNGKINGGGEVTLTANSATTTLTDALLGTQSRIHLTPMTSNGAAALAGLYVSARAKGTATLTHANNAQTDRTFMYSIFG